MAQPRYDKRSWESEPYSMDFGPRLATGEALTSSPTCAQVPIAGDPGLAIGPAAIAGTKVVAQISGGTPGMVYELKWSANTNLGEIGDFSTLAVVDS